MEFRVEKDTMGEVLVPSDALWGAQTQRSIENFKIGTEKLSPILISALACVKRSAAIANCSCGTLPKEKCKAIVQSCDEILGGNYADQFPLVIWQTGSGTQSNMNMNEVISRICNLKDVHLQISPNDDVNKSQSTNDVFPTAMRVGSTLMISEGLLPALQHLKQALKEKKEAFSNIKKIGRTHLMDATPLTLGDEFSAYESQLIHCERAIINSLAHLSELPIGGTAVGNGINTPIGYDVKVVEELSAHTGYPFIPADNKFEGMASHDSFVEMSGALKRLATSLMKIANDIRLLGSGPRCGLGELQLPENEPGSSIMPGKVNPTQCEALAMVCCQVIGNDCAITTGAIQGHLQLNAYMPLIANNILHSIEILRDSMRSFTDNCVIGITANTENISKHYENSLMRVTALNPIIGYYEAARVAQHAHKNGLTLREAVVELGIMSAEEFATAMEK